MQPPSFVSTLLSSPCSSPLCGFYARCNCWQVFLCPVAVLCASSLRFCMLVCVLYMLDLHSLSVFAAFLTHFLSVFLCENAANREAAGQERQPRGLRAHCGRGLHGPGEPEGCFATSVLLSYPLGPAPALAPPLLPPSPPLPAPPLRPSPFCLSLCRGCLVINSN